MEPGRRGAGRKGTLPVTSPVAVANNSLEAVVVRRLDGRSTMKTWTRNFRVGSGGRLRVNRFVGKADADRDVRLRIQPPGETRTECDPAEAWVESLARRWLADCNRVREACRQAREPQL
jgi:hypothetical protein